MQLAQDNNVLKTNAKFERQHFGVGDMSIVMELLTKLYSNPIQTLTQEYICNGRDANRENKTKKKLEITVPTKFSPTLKVRDYGIGLTPERISNVFLLYGNSTKRVNNKQTGGFGIGAKSAWSYTDSFTIFTYVDGIERTYLAHKSSGNGNLDLISEVETNEPNGTCVEIAVKQFDTDRFKNAVFRATFFWNDKEKPIIHGITDVDKEVIRHDFEFDKVRLYDKLPSFLNGYGKSYFVVIDGIPYKLPKEIEHKENFTKLNILVKANIVMSINTGDIEVAPSREEFIINDNTKEFLDNHVFEPARISISNFIISKKMKANTIQKCLEMYKELGKTFEIERRWGDWSIGYDGRRLDNTNWHKGYILNISETTDDKIKKEKRISLPIDQIGVVFYNDIKESPVAINKRFRTLLDKDSKDIYYLNSPTKEMIKDLNAVKISTIDPTETPKTVSVRTNTPISKREIVLHKLHHTQTSYCRKEWRSSPKKHIIGEVNEEIIYIPMSHEMANKNNRKNYTELFTYLKDVYLIADSRIGLIQNNTYFIHIDNYIKDYKLSTDEKNQLLANEIDNKDQISFIKNKFNEITDKDLSKVLEVATKWNNNKDIAPPILAKQFIESKSFKSFKNTAKKVSKSLKYKYPLVFCDDATKWKNETIEYMNYIHNKGV